VRERETGLAFFVLAVLRYRGVPGLKGVIGMYAAVKEELRSALVSAAVVFLRTYMGEQVATVSAEAAETSVTVRVTCVSAETGQHPAGFDLWGKLKTEALERAEPLLKALIEGVANTTVTGVHSVFRVDTGECTKIFTLGEDPGEID
jgi:hypothetical protein